MPNQPLLTETVRRLLPPVYSQEHTPDPQITVKFFCPWNQWTWYAYEGAPVTDESGQEIDFEFFGLVVGQETELGYFTLAELDSVRGRGGLKIERDLYFDPTPLSQIRAAHERAA
jgi:hypothetical protein